MKVLVVGSGAREHALAWKLAQSPEVDVVYCEPGNAGTALTSKCQNLVGTSDIVALARWADAERIDLTVVGPEAPLVAGIVDLWPKDLRIWGPNASAACLEGSKIFAKEAMDRHGIPTARWSGFDNVDEAKDWLERQDEDDWVTKPDGLTGGKGVEVHATKAEAFAAIDRITQYGDAANRFILERRFRGREASLFLLCNANGTIVPLAPAQDYKLSGNGDTGINTGGMGSYSPTTHLTDAMIADIIAKLQPMILEVGFTGFLYVGLMLTEDGWYVLEFNVRLGDPETSVVIPRLVTDLFSVLYAMSRNEEPDTLIWSPKAAVTVVMVNKGYPGSYPKGGVISGLDCVQEVAPGAIVFHAGTRQQGDYTVADGGRNLDITGLGDNVAEARAQAYKAVSVISWPNAAFRDDIAAGV